MAKPRASSEIRLVNGSTGDPVLFIDYPGRDDALLFDAGENGGLDPRRLADLGAVFITHHHVDHFIGLDRIVRANLDRDKTLHVFGPSGTIRKGLRPDQELRISVLPVPEAGLDGPRRRAWPDPDGEPGMLEEVPGTRAGRIRLGRDRPCSKAAGIHVEAAFADHTVPCLAFALVEEPGYHPDPEKLASGSLRPGPWVGQVLTRLRSGEAPDALDDHLRRSILARRPGRRLLRAVAELASGLRHRHRLERRSPARPAPKLAHRAWRLYCDSFYSRRELKQAEKHRHMTATQAAEFAREAKVESLVLIHFASRYEGRYESWSRKPARSSRRPRPSCLERRNSEARPAKDRAYHANAWL